MDMIFDSPRNASSAPENSCHRQNAAECKRRKRMELRKMKTVAKEKTYGEDYSSSSSYSDSTFKKKKKKKKKKKPRNDDVVAATSSTTVGGVTSHGKISVIGRRREMEDAVAVELGFVKIKGGGENKFDFFGVYDGHGGWRVASACSEMLHKLLVVEILEENGGEVIEWEKVMKEGFEKMDEEVNKNGGDEVATTGSTAVVAVVGEEELVVANCGDSRAVLCRGGAALQLLDDHKPDRPDELERIEVSGGKVINWNGQRVLGVLATSRSIGDYYLKPFVITEPEVKVVNRTDSDEFLILASDGLWDVVSNDLACRVVRRCLDGRIKKSSQFAMFQDENNERDHQSGEETMNECLASEAAAVLTELAMGRGSRDNISVIVVDLRRATSG